MEGTICKGGLVVDQAEIHRMVISDDMAYRQRAAVLFGESFPAILDKSQAWQDLRRLTEDKDKYVREGAIRALGSAFPSIPDDYKTQAWQDLHKLTADQDIYVRVGAAEALGSAFSSIPDIYKAQAWQDLHRLTADQDKYVRLGATRALGSAFSSIPDDYKAQAWQDLHRLTTEWYNVRLGATRALGLAFSSIPDDYKAQAWQDLHRLTADQDKYVRGGAAGALGLAFSHVPDKDLAWEDLYRLTQDEQGVVRMYAYHSLGKVSVYKATESEDKNAQRRHLEKAIEYFEESSQKAYYSPARFCHPFYRSYFAITFQGESQEAVQKYLAEAKKAVGWSESKELLLKAVENLAGALQESERLKDRSTQVIASELNAYRWYCDNAAEHMNAAEAKAPGAIRLMRKCNPLLEGRIQATIAEIQRSARKICQITRGSGTEFEAPGAEINRAAKALSSEEIFRTQQSVTRIASQLKEFCRLLPSGKRESICSAVKEIELATEFPDKLDKIELAFAYVGSAVESALLSGDVRSDIKQMLTELGVVNNKLDEIRYAIFKQRISSGNAISNLTSIKSELEKLYQFSQKHTESSLRDLYSCRDEQLQELSKDLEDRFAELKDVLTKKASIDDVKMILDKLDRLKPMETWNSNAWNLADKGATLLTYISFLQDVITILRPK
jgi:HEAT repeat protein